MTMLRTLALVGVMSAAGGGMVSQQAPASDCPVTQPNHHAAPKGSEGLAAGMAVNWYGNDAVGTDLWPDGAVTFKPGGAGTVLADGSLRMKFYWLKAPGTRLTVEGHRVDDKSVLLRSVIDHQFDAQGQQPSYLIFATPGCWSVTAHAGAESLSFVTSVVKVGDGSAHAK